MKFTNGYWLLRDGVSAIYAREAYELHPDTERKEVNIVATSMKVNDRANTLNLPIFDVTPQLPGRRRYPRAIRALVRSYAVSRLPAQRGRCAQQSTRVGRGSGQRRW